MRRSVVAFFFTGLLAAFSVVGAACSSAHDPHEILGLRLGYTPEQVRRSFTLRERGHFTTESNPDLKLIWMPETPERSQNSVERVTLEFHDGLLVAVRVTVGSGHPLARGDFREIRATSVLVRDKMPTGVTQIRLIARDCPAHVTEVRSMLNGTNSR